MMAGIDYQLVVAPVLGQAGTGGTGEVDVGSTVLWSIVFVLLLAALFWSLMWLRKKMKGDESGDLSGVSTAGFTLGDLRQLYKDGKMSSDEYERAKARILDSTKAAARIPPARETRPAKDGL